MNEPHYPTCCTVINIQQIKAAVSAGGIPFDLLLKRMQEDSRTLEQPSHLQADFARKV